MQKLFKFPVSLFDYDKTRQVDCFVHLTLCFLKKSDGFWKDIDLKLDLCRNNRTNFFVCYYPNKCSDLFLTSWANLGLTKAGLNKKIGLFHCLFNFWYLHTLHRISNIRLSQNYIFDRDNSHGTSTFVMYLEGDHSWKLDNCFERFLICLLFEFSKFPIDFVNFWQVMAIIIITLS